MSVNDFATRAESIKDVPELFKTALIPHLDQSGGIRSIIVGPSFKTLGERTPATLLVITSSHWLLLSDDESGNIFVAKASYGQTLLLELTHVLLYGELKIHFAQDGELKIATSHFNTVMMELYREAIDLILEGMNGIKMGTANKHPAEPMVNSNWPRHFWFAVPNNLPGERGIQHTVYWPAVYGGFHREIAPAAVMAVTNLEIVLISEEKAWARSLQNQKMGTVATYVPFSRLKSVRVEVEERVAMIDLELEIGQGTEMLKFAFPPDHKTDVEKAVAVANLQLNKK